MKMNIKGRILAVVAVTLGLFGMLGAAAPANAAPAPAISIQAGGWPQPGGCAPSWQPWNSSKACGTVTNNSGFGIKIVKNWKWSQYNTVTLDSFNASDLTGLSNGYTFGEPQGYDVDGFCLQRGQYARRIMEVPLLYWGNTQGLCWKISGWDKANLVRA